MNLDKDVEALGRLLGVVNDQGGFNDGWFSDVPSQLASMGSRLQNLVVIADDLLGPSKDSPSPVLPKSKWYPLPNPKDTSKKLPVFITCGAPTDESGEIGLGAIHEWTSGKLKAVTYLYLPLVSYSPDGATVLPGNKDHPGQLGVRIAMTGDSNFTGPSKDTFKALVLDAKIPLSNDPPSGTMLFEKLSAKPDTYTRLADITDTRVRGLLSDVVAQTSDWLDGKVNDKITRGELLKAAGLLIKDEKKDEKAPNVYHLTLEKFKGWSGAELAETFFYATLDALAGTNIPVVPTKDGGVFVDKRSDKNADYYALRLQGTVALTRPPAKKGPPASSLVLSLGSWLTGEKDGTSWLKRAADNKSKPGVDVELLKRTKDGKGKDGKPGTVSFAPAVRLVSVGLNAKGAGDAPLFSVAGVSAAGADLRVLVDWATGDRGFAILLDKMALPLGGSFGTASTKAGNPVAKNLLASGDAKDAAQSGQKSAVAPAFRASAAWVKGKSPVYQVLNDKGEAQDRVWFPVQRRFGPISCRRVGVTIHTTGPTLDVIFDGAVALAGLNVDLDQLTVGVPLKTATQPSTYALDLRGMDVSYDGGPVKVSGGLLKVPLGDGRIEYDGEATIQTKTMALHALGSYATLSDADGGGTSLFVFAFLNRPIGGPPFLYITGLAAGFGYNRSLKVPTLAELRKFPLLAALADASAIGGKNPTAGTALAKLHDWVPPTRGEYWLAAGARFTTFEVVNTSALLAVQFGAELVVAVLGRSVLKQPIQGETFAYAELDLVAEYRPSLGELRCTAVLAPGSYVLTKDAHLTGGFAFASWFGPSTHAGDFVFTIGGYHPAFTVPSHYPVVPRVGINWQIDSHTAMVGGAYFAITPTAMMGGIALQVTFSDGPLKAWLKASADGILYYKPFYLVVSASISVGVSFEVNLLFVTVTLSVEIGADFMIWGPPVGYRVHVDWYVVSFTLGDGAPNPPRSITWEQFRELLPRQQGSGKALHAENAGKAENNKLTAAADSAVLTVNPRRGLASSHTDSDLTFWMVRAGQLAIDVSSAVPASTVLVKSAGKTGDRNLKGATVAMRSVEGGIPSSRYQSTQTVKVTVLRSTKIADIKACIARGGADELFDLDDWDADPLNGALPPALWGDPVPGGQDANINPDHATITGTAGVTLRPKAPDDSRVTPAMDMETVFADFTVNADDAYQLSVAPGTKPCPAVPARAATFTDLRAVNEDPAAGQRAALYAALSSLGINGWTNEPLDDMQDTPGLAFADEPMEGQPLCEPVGAGAGVGGGALATSSGRSGVQTS